MIKGITQRMNVEIENEKSIREENEKKSHYYFRTNYTKT